MERPFFILGIQFPIKEIPSNLWTSSILMTQQHRVTQLGLSPPKPFSHSLPCVTDTRVSFGAVCSFVCTVFCSRRLCVLVLPWHHTSEVLQLALGPAWRLGRACSIPHQLAISPCERQEEKPLSLVPEWKAF